jgi:hypothetical protein
MDLNKVELEELYLIKQLLQNNLDKPVIEIYYALLEYYWNKRDSFKKNVEAGFLESAGSYLLWTTVVSRGLYIVESSSYLSYKTQLKTIIKPILKKYKKKIYKILLTQNESIIVSFWWTEKKYIIKIFLDKNLYFHIYHRFNVFAKEFELNIKLSYSFEKEEKYISEDRLSEFIKILEKINQENINIDDLISKKGGI